MKSTTSLVLPLVCASFLAVCSPHAVAQQPQAPARKIPLDEIQKFAGLLNMIHTDYVTPTDDKVLMTSCMKGVLAGLDAQSAYLDRSEFDDLRHGDPSGSVGIGVEMVLRSGLPMVTTAIEASPAARAGLRPKDYILEIDGQSTEERELKDVFKQLRGAPGSSVTLVTRRVGEVVNRTTTLRRAEIQVPRVSSAWVAPGVGYMRPGHLNDRTAPEVREHFARLQASGPLRGLVLDMRNSPGGLLTAVVENAAMFLPAQAVVVSTEGQLLESNQTFLADRNKILDYRNAKRDAWPEAMKTVPLIVLVNGGTVSGSEIVAAALKDHRRAKLVGSKTFGRGTIQTIRALTADSAVKLTTAFYRTPAGNRLERIGLEPDIKAPELEQAEDAGTPRDQALAQAVALLK